MKFYEIEFPLAGMSLSEVETALQELGALSISFVDRGDEPVLEPKPGEFRLWSDTLVRALFEAPLDVAADALSNLGRLSSVLGKPVSETARVHAVADQEWERVWLKDWKSMRFGRRLWVCPREAQAPADLDAVVLRLDPGLAFGTGTHPTTALCLQVLDSLPLSGQSVLDYGCGSGILAIAALKLGAMDAVAVDLDPQALLATRDNALLNQVSANIVIQGVDVPLQPVHGVMANILAGPLIDLAPALSAACVPGGWILLSGLLHAQADAVAAAYQPGFEVVQTIEREGWCAIHARRVL